MSGLVWAGCPEGYRENDRTGVCDEIPYLKEKIEAKKEADKQEVEAKKKAEKREQELKATLASFHSRCKDKARRKQRS
jgi:hypothetical protein